MSEPTKHKTVVRSFGIGFWVGALLFIACLGFWTDNNGLTIRDAIVQAINPAWQPKVYEP